MRHIALLRGINVGGHKVVKMAELRELLSEIGFENVKTLLQSGNCVFDASGEGNHSVAIESAISERLQMDVDVLVFGVNEWEAIVANNPLPLEANEHPSRFLVVACKSPIQETEAEALAGYAADDEHVALVSGHLYLSLPSGVATSRVMASPAWRKLSNRATARNWSTVTKLLELSRS